jgi:hypothetical protein
MKGEGSMKSALHRVSTITWIVAAGVLLLVSPTARADGDHANKPCTNGTVKGTYGFYRTGPGPNGPVSAVGIIHFDGHGNVSLIQDVVRDGEPSPDETGTGTYQVDANCRARGYDEDGNEISRTVIVDDGDGFYFISMTGTNVYGVGRRLQGR